MRLPNRDRSILEETSSTWKPTVILYFVQAMIVVSHWINRCEKGVGIYRQGVFRTFGNEVITIVGIVVTDAYQCRIAFPTYWSTTIKEAFATNKAAWNFL